MKHLRGPLLVQHFFFANGHFVPHQGQDGHNPNHQSQMKQVQGYMETHQKEGDTDVSNAPKANQEQQHGVMEGAEDESWDRQDELEQRGGEPGVQRQRRQEDRHHRLTRGQNLKNTNIRWRHTEFTFKVFFIYSPS